MSVRTRIALWILVLVGGTALVSWFAVQRVVIRPFTREIQARWVRQVGRIARRIEAGEAPERVEEMFGVEVERWEGPLPRRRRMRRVEGREVVFARQKLALVRGPDGLYAVRPVWDPERGTRGFPLLLAALAAMIVVVALWIARRSTEPLARTTAAMVRMGEGDLQHRLPEEGPPEIRDAARAFNRLADRVKVMLETERQLLAGISHELRTPLTRLRLEVELLREAGVEPRRLDRMEEDLTQIDDLIGEALDLSKLQLGGEPLRLEPLDLRVLAESYGGHDVDIRGAGRALGDRFLLGRALENLLSNARKYAPGSPITITVDGATIRVADAGPGVPEAELDQLFEPFYRTHKGSRRADGHGLGLMLVKTIVELHGGSVRAKNLDPGLEVTLELLRVP